MKKVLLLYPLFYFLFIFDNIFAQEQLWSKVVFPLPNALEHSNKIVTAGKSLLSKIDVSVLKSILNTAPLEHSAEGVAGIPFALLLPDESTLTTLISASPIWEKKYAGQFNEVKTFQLTDPNGKVDRGRITLTSEGISGILFTDRGDVYISPVTEMGSGMHHSYFTNDALREKVTCAAGNEGNGFEAINDIATQSAADCGSRTYRLAVATTAEYTQWAGSQANALTYITISINNVTAIYSRDLNIRFSIVAPNSILFTNSATDPYPGGDVYLDDAATNANQIALDNIIGSTNYDLGIVFNKGWNRGYVPYPVGTVCNASRKGKSAAGILNGSGLNPTPGPQGLSFDFTVIHEMGHQFGAPHSYASKTGLCTNYGTASSAYEPGSGSTIMGYAGYTDCNTYTQYGEFYFHAGSIIDIRNYLNGGGNCVLPEGTGNSAPFISIPANTYNVPVSTPFTLSGTGTDNEGDNIIYNWEQINTGFQTTLPPAPTNTGGPNFRSYAPSTAGNVRDFPRLIDLVNATPTPWEVLPSVARTMNFRLTARDRNPKGGCTAESDVAVNFKNTAGPFTVTSQPSAITWAAYSSQTISWNVASTNLSPINCTQVDILFSTDGGLTYPYTLVSNTSNDGSENITTPNLATTTGRIKVQPVNNIFFNINAANISITASCAADGATITPTDTIAAPAGNASLNLTLSPQYGIGLTPSGTINNSNPISFLTMYNNSINLCASYGFYGSSKYNIHPFVVTTPGTYTFTRNVHGLVYNIYREAFYPGTPCLNFIASNTVTGQSPTTINAFVSAYLLPGRYELVAGTFSATFPVLPFTYSLTVTGGTIYTNPPNPGAAFSYWYVVVDKTTNLIKSISSAADLSNTITFPGGNKYAVYGLSYAITSPSLNSFIGDNFASLKQALLTNASYCGNLSKNAVNVSALSLYTFTGNGNWNNPANWSNNSIPPSPLPPLSAIYINPANGGDCILNVPMSIPQGGQLKVEPGKKFKIMGNLTIEQ